MTIRKPFFLLVVVLAIAMFVVGFAGVAADKVITLKVLYYRDATNPGIAREDAELWGAFAKNNPDIKIEREDLFNEPYHQKISALSAADDLPDLMYLWPSGRSSMLYNKGQIKDLRPLLEKSGEAKNFMEAALAPQAGGILGEIPMTVTASHAMYVKRCWPTTAWRFQRPTANWSRSPRGWTPGAKMPSSWVTWTIG